MQTSLLEMASWQLFPTCFTGETLLLSSKTRFFDSVHLNSVATAPCCNRDNPPLKELKDASKGERTSLQAWEERHKEEQVLSDIEKLQDGLRGMYHIENFGAIGFCIGALHSALLAGGTQVGQPFSG